MNKYEHRHTLVYKYQTLVQFVKTAPFQQSWTLTGKTTQVQPESCPGSLLQLLLQLAWLGLPILKQPTCRQTGTYTLPQFPDESGLLLIPPRWCSHFPVAVMAAACWGFSALIVQHHWMKNRRKPWQNPTLLLRAWLLPGSLLLAVSSMWLLTAWPFHGLAWKELATALGQETGWFANQGTLEIWEMGEHFHLHQREAES